MQEFDRDISTARAAAVLLLLYPRNEKIHFVLILRNSYKGVHSSQMALPGGKKEASDVDFLQTALRETEEEVGVSRNDVEIIRELTDVYIPPSNFLVHPVIGICRKPPIFKPDPREVAGIVEVDLEEFLSDQTLISVQRETSYADEIRVPAFKINENIIWGATAMILSEFKEVIKSSC